MAVAAPHAGPARLPPSTCFPTHPQFPAQQRQQAQLGAGWQCRQSARSQNALPTDGAQAFPAQCIGCKLLTLWPPRAGGARRCSPPSRAQTRAAAAPSTPPCLQGGGAVVGCLQGLAGCIGVGGLPSGFGRVLRLLLVVEDSKARQRRPGPHGAGRPLAVVRTAVAVAARQLKHGEVEGVVACRSGGSVGKELGRLLGGSMRLGGGRQRRGRLSGGGPGCQPSPARFKLPWTGARRRPC